MKAAIYNPYFDTLGGGERYTITFAKVLVELGYKVDIEWTNNDILEKLHERFGLSTTGITCVSTIRKGIGYDLCFWVSDGSVPFLLSKKNILHFQVPFKNVGGKSITNKLKFLRIDCVFCNSQFTKSVIDKEYGINSYVLYPPIDIESFEAGKKERSILYVGRFSELEQSKRQDILIEAFKNFSKKNKNWKLILAGGTDIGAEIYLKKLKKMANGYPIEFVEKPPFSELVKLYKKATFFWTAAGYGIDENEYPRKMEHFGMSLVEAMSSGCIPFAYNGGGHKEIVENTNNGFLWKDKSQLIATTNELILDQKRLKDMQKKVIKSATRYSTKEFKKEIEIILL